MTTNRRQFLRYAGATLAASQMVACGRSRVPVEAVPANNFDEDSTADDVTSGIDMAGKIIVVTGCTSGIGLETMRVLASRGAVVVGSSRSRERAEKACRSVVGTTIPVELELGDYASVVQCAEEIRALQLPIDVLICNAGHLGGGNERILLNGLEKHFATNYLGHFIFVNRLLDRLYIAEQGRIVMTSSMTAYTDSPRQGILFDDLGFRHDYGDQLAYGHSKLAISLFSLELSRLLSNTRITTNSMHPGIIATEIGRNSNSLMRFGLKLLAATVGKSIQQGAANGCYLASNPSLATTSGEYFEDCQAITVGGNHHLYDAAMAKRLLSISEDLVSDFVVSQEIPEMMMKMDVN